MKDAEIAFTFSMGGNLVRTDFPENDSRDFHSSLCPPGEGIHLNYT